MSYIWEIPGWNSGARVRLKHWSEGHYIARVERSQEWFRSLDLMDLDLILRSAMCVDGWELYEDKPVEVEVFEWMELRRDGDYWYINPYPKTEETAKAYYLGEEYCKTGRSWKVPVRK